MARDSLFRGLYQIRDKIIGDTMQAGERVYHRRKNDPIAVEGYCEILEIGPLKAKVIWEHNKKDGVVEVRDLITEEEAEALGIDH